jgi:hypothetical protein
MYLHRVVMKNDPGTGQIQAGWVTTGSGIELDNCGSLDAATADYVETIVVGGGTTCYQYTTWPGGIDWNFNVYVNSNGWNVKVNGDVDPDGPSHIGMATGQVQVGGESWTGSGAGKAAACYGEGASAWDYYPAQTDGGSGSILVSPNADTTTHVTGELSIGAAPTPLCDNLG